MRIEALHQVLMRRAVYEAITQSDMGIVKEKVKEDAKVTLKIATSVEDTTKNILITIKLSIQRSSENLI